RRATPGSHYQPVDTEVLPRLDVLGSRHGRAQRDREVRPARGAQALHDGLGRLEGVAHAEPPVAALLRPAQRGRRLATDEHRQRLLHGLGLEGDGIEREELAAVLDALLAPQAAAHIDGLVEPAPTRLEVPPDGLPLGLQPPGADAYLGPA